MGFWIARRMQGSKQGAVHGRGLCEGRLGRWEVRIVTFWGSGEGGAGSEQSIWRAFEEGKGSAEQGNLWIECTGRGMKGRH